MQCQEFQVRLDDVLDARGRPDADAALRAHADGCRTCRALLAGQEALYIGLASARRRTPGADLADRVLGELHAAPPATIAPWQFAVPLMAAAAAVLIAVLPLLKSADPAPRADQLANGANVGATAGHPSAVTGGIGTRSTAGRPTGPYVVFVRETGHGLATVVFQQFPGVGLASLAGDSTSPVATQAPWVSQMTGGLKPITDSMSEAFNTLLRALPQGSQESRS